MLKAGYQNMAWIFGYFVSFYIIFILCKNHLTNYSQPKHTFWKYPGLSKEVYFTNEI